ncbi:MAG: LURP-one-related family protein [Planctomycetota bacterium]|nr:LURP-one-related family protein [Planctomycetota bacterium]
MKQKLFSWGEDFTIKDEAGHDVYFVDGQAFSLGAKLSFQDMSGRELVFIQQKLLSWGPTYELHREGRLVAVVKKKLFTFFKCEFTIDVPGPNDPIAEGDFMHHEYEFRRGLDVIGRVSKQWFSWTDTYGVEIAPGEDDVLLLASTVVIDMACHKNDN